VFLKYQKIFSTKYQYKILYGFLQKEIDDAIGKIFLKAIKY